MALYFYLHLFTLSFPLVRSFESRIKYATKWKYLFPAIFITGTFFLVWDVIFTYNGVWGFNEDYLLGVYLFKLPLEEWLFFLTVPFSSVFIYECVLYFMKKDILGGSGSKILIGVAVFLIIAALLNIDRAYTFWNFLFTGLFILVSLRFLKPANVDRFIIAYLIHLIPFMIVNGVLTGSITDEPIVWYNDEQNLGFRVFTIPIEDTIYALLLLFMNVSFYEYFMRSKSVNDKNS
ncbi:MAG: lycopene cyclase domain-containing protein [Bacteroidota bacterium]